MRNFTLCYKPSNLCRTSAMNVQHLSVFTEVTNVSFVAFLFYGLQ